MKKNFRLELKRLYKKKRQEDGRTIGREVDELVNSLHDQHARSEVERDLPLIKATVSRLKEIRAEARFRDDFPGFASFKKFFIETNREIHKKNLQEKDPLLHEPLIGLDDLRS